MDTPPADNNSFSNKSRRKKSIVWEYFTIETIGPDCTRANCKQCKKSFAYITGSKLAGTSHLKRHITLGICPINRQNMENKKESLYSPVVINSDVATNNVPRKRYRATPGLGSSPFDQYRSNYELAKMIILHSLPLDITEQPEFIGFIRTLQPHFTMVKFDSVEADCLSIYHREKQGILKIIGGISGRVSLSVDLWTSDQTVGYAIITGQFLDTDWKLNRRILNVVAIPFPNSEISCNLAIATCIMDWNLDGRVFTITHDKSFADGDVRENFRARLSIRNPQIIGGQLLIGNCYSRVLSSLAQEAFRSMDTTIDKIRESVKYVNSSEVVKQKFMNLRKQVRGSSMKSLIIDDVTKWNTTYDMLVTAKELKEVFSRLKSLDPNYKEMPSTGEWEQVETLCSLLEPLFDAANIIKSTNYPTANTFFQEVYKIQLELAQASVSEDTFIRNLVKPLKDIFDRYWSETSLVLAIAVVMDPRFKMRFLEFSFARMYGDNADVWIKAVDEGVREIFLEYIVQSLPAPTFIHEGNDIVAKTELPEEECLLLLPNYDDLSDFDIYLSELASNQQTKSELDQYLEESLLPRVQDFNVLGWWNGNRLNYPVLSRMAADILMIPVSTVGVDSVFNTVSNKMDSYKTSLRPSTLESIICAKDWLQYGSSSSSNAIVKLEY